VPRQAQDKRNKSLDREDNRRRRSAHRVVRDEAELFDHRAALQDRQLVVVVVLRLELAADADVGVQLLEPGLHLFDLSMPVGCFVRAVAVMVY
jgi:hypothetical protein